MIPHVVTSVSDDKRFVHLQPLIFDFIYGRNPINYVGNDPVWDYEYDVPPNELAVLVDKPRDYRTAYLDASGTYYANNVYRVTFNGARFYRIGAPATEEVPAQELHIGDRAERRGTTATTRHHLSYPPVTNVEPYKEQGKWYCRVHIDHESRTFEIRASEPVTIIER